MATLLYSGRTDHLLYGRYVYRYYLCLCDWTCDRCYGNPLDLDRKIGDAASDTDRRHRSDRTCQYYLHFPEPEDQYAESPYDPGILQSGSDGRTCDSGKEGNSLCACGGRNGSCGLCLLFCPQVWTWKRAEICCFYGCICILQCGD